MPPVPALTSGTLNLLVHALEFKPSREMAPALGLWTSLCGSVRLLLNRVSRAASPFQLLDRVIVSRKVFMSITRLRRICVSTNSIREVDLRNG